MENKAVSPSRSESILKKYHQLTSPLVSLQTVKRQDLMKEELRQNVSMKLDCIKSRSSKVYALDSSISYPQLKAAATLYQIPEFSTPEVNFEVSEQIRKKVEEAKREMISHFPEISKSSNYAPKKIEHQLSHRTAVRQLEEWLSDKLRTPPTSSQESIQYKNMIMGVGMKELIRIIGRRCAEEGRMAEEIWELTWSICREIILYLSKRARKCEQLLEEELLFMRASYHKEFDRLTAEHAQMLARATTLEQENKACMAQLQKLKKRKGMLEDQNKSLAFGSVHLQQEFKKVLEENLAIYLQIGDKNKRGWIKKMYKNIKALNERTDQALADIFKREIIEVVQDRNQLEEVTGDCEDPIEPQEVDAIGNGEIIKTTRKKQRNKQKAKKNRKISNTKHPQNPQSDLQDTLITEPADLSPEEETKSEHQSESDSDIEAESEGSCMNMITHMHEEFLPIDAEVQTEVKQLIDAYASTHTPELSEQTTGVDSSMLGYLQEMGVNTEEVKEEPKVAKKKGKENIKDEPRKDKSKIYSNTPTREKSKPKVDKDKKSILDIVQELNTHHEESRLSQKEESISLPNDQPTLEVTGVDSKTELSKQVQGRPFNKKNSFFANSEVAETLKTNSAIYSSAFSQEVREKSHLGDHKEEIGQHKDDTIIRRLQQNLAPIPIHKSLEKDSNSSFLSDELGKQKERQKQLHSISFDSAMNQGRISALGVLNESIMYVCAECNKILTSIDQKYEHPRGRVSRLDKHSLQGSPSASAHKFSPEEYFEDGPGGRKRRQGRKNSSYIHDIGFKKEMEEQQLQQQPQQSFKSPYYNNGKDESNQNTINHQQASEEQSNIFNKVAPYALFFSQMMEGNKQLVQNIVNAPQQVAQNLQHYFQLVREINGLPQNKATLTEKSMISVIEKTVFPIINELLVSVKKAVKANKVAEMMRVFTSLPNIVYNRITRKYGVKILAIKNLKVLLMALKQASRYTEKYKIIELMMFTDCKSPHSQDLFMYLFIMALFDPTFSSSKLIARDDAGTVRRLCQEYLTKQGSIYHQFDRLIQEGQSEGVLLSSLIKSVVTNYRLLKINRIQEVGFVYLMLKKDHHMSYKKFIYFLDTLKLPHPLKLAIAKKLLQFCDIKNKDQRVGISEIMFSKFLMNCQDFSYQLLEETINQQLQTYRCTDRDIVTHLSHQFFRTQKYIKTKMELQEARNKSLLDGESPRDSIAIDRDSSQLSSLQQGTGQQGERVIENITVVPQIKQYSSFTNQVCLYLENAEETKYLTYSQHLFVKNYLIVHIIQSEIESTVGLVDYFSNAMLHTLTLPLHRFNIDRP